MVTPSIASDHFFQLLAAWMNEPSSIVVLCQEAAKLKARYTVAQAFKMLSTICRRVSKLSLDAELEVLTRQGAGQTTGTIAMMQALGVIRQSAPQAALSRDLEAEPQVGADPPMLLGLTKQEFVFLNDTKVLQQVLNAARTLTLPQLETSADLIRWARVFDSMLALMPPECNTGGTDVGPHLRIKFMLAALRGLVGPRRGKGSSSVDLGMLPAMLVIRLSGPDQRQFRSSVPAVMRAGRLSRILGVRPELLGMYGCLWHEACSKLHDATLFLEEHSSKLPKVLEEYVVQHGVAPSPYLLLDAAMVQVGWTPRAGRRPTPRRRFKRKRPL